MTLDVYDRACEALFLDSCTMTAAHPENLEPVREVALLLRHALETKAQIPSPDMLTIVRGWGRDAADLLGAATQAAIASLGDISIAVLGHAITWLANLRRALLQACEIDVPRRHAYLHAVAN